MPRDTTAVLSADRTENLEQIVAMLARTAPVRSELVADIRGQMQGGDYMAEEKLDLAIYQMLRSILG